MQGPKKRRGVENQDQAKALAYFLAKEILRHRRDIEAISDDLARLRAKWGIPEPDVEDPEEWIEV